MNETMDPLDIDQDHGHGDNGDETIYSCTRCQSDWFGTPDSIAHEAACKYANVSGLVEATLAELFMCRTECEPAVLRAALCAAWEEGHEAALELDPSKIPNPYKDPP